jgi:peptidoglycan/xylan/chitin deacetylase (PgdA/CDA1 family)
VVAGLKTVVKVGASALDRVRTPPSGVTILIYHRVGAGAGGEMDLTPEAFDIQLAWLDEHRDVISLDHAVDLVTGNAAQPMTGREVVLTFDDGTGDWVDHVLPALERHRTPATFYVATSFVEDQVTLPGAGKPISWAGLGELAGSTLTTIGSHTHGHMLLDRLDAARTAQELDRSVELLGEHTGSAPKHFAYPKAVLGSPAAEAAVTSRFRSAVIAGTRPNPPGTDPHRLHRSPIQASDGQRWFKRKAMGAMRAEDDLRRLANRLRYRNLDS